MKHFFLWAVAISALCSSCETADESLLNSNNIPNQTLQTQQRTVSDYDVYNNVVSSFVYDAQDSHYNNLLLFQQHVNYMVPNNSITETIDFTQLSVLENADINYIEQLNYSTEAKAVIITILNETFNVNTLTLITNTKEYNLITTLYAMYSDGNGDNGDGKWKDKITTNH